MSVLARLRLYRALSGLTVDCVPTFTQGVVLQDESFRMNPWALIFRAPGAASRLCRALKGHHI